MLGWEFPPFVSGGLGIHCFELTRALAALGVEIDFFMPATTTPVFAPWMRVIQVSEASFSEFSRKVRLPLLVGSSYTGRRPFAQGGAGFGGGTGALKLNGKGEVQAYGLDFFEAVQRYNLLVQELVGLYDSKARYDLVHCHDWITAKAGVALKKSRALPFVFTVHSTEFDRTANLWPFEWILNVEREGVREADKVITVSRQSRQQLISRLGADPEKVSVVYNAIDCSKFSQRARKEQFGISEKIVLFHGRLSVQKGVEFFIRAAKKVLEREKNVRFIVSGKGDLLPRLVDLAVELGIADKVSFAGYMEEEKLPVLYAISDVFVLPSVSEPFGITALEAMASGTPVIVSKSSGVTEIANHCLKVDFWDVDEMANKILALLRYPALGPEMAGNECAEVKNFSWDKTAGETLRVYREAAAGSGTAIAAEQKRYERQLYEIHPQ